MLRTSLATPLTLVLPFYWGLASHSGPPSFDSFQRAVYSNLQHDLLLQHDVLLQAHGKKKTVCSTVVMGVQQPKRVGAVLLSVATMLNLGVYRYDVPSNSTAAGW